MRPIIWILASCNLNSRRMCRWQKKHNQHRLYITIYFEGE